MTTLFLATAAIAANVSLVVFVANLLAPKAVTRSANGTVVAGNENGFASARKLAA